MRGIKREAEVLRGIHNYQTGTVWQSLSLALYLVSSSNAPDLEKSYSPPTTDGKREAQRRFQNPTYMVDLGFSLHSVCLYGFTPTV